MSDEIKKEIKKDQWSAMSFEQLQEQKTIMMDRIIFLYEKGYKDQAQVLQKGLEELNALIFK